MRTQYGVISRQQAIAEGLTPRQIDHRVHQGDWHRPLRAIYASRDVRVGLIGKLMALSLWADERGAVSHLSAAYLWSLRIAVSERPEVTVTDRRRAPRADIVVHQAPLDPADVAYVGPIRVTTVARTLVDLAAVLHEEELEIAIDDARRRGLVTWARLRWQLKTTGGKGRPGSAVLRRILDARQIVGIRDSGLETRLGRVFRRSPIRQPMSQYRITVAARFIARVDFAWPQEKIGIECESYEWHSGRQEWSRDTRRLNDLAADGWIVLRATDEDVRHPDPLLSKLERLLERRGQGRLRS